MKRTILLLVLIALATAACGANDDPTVSASDESSSEQQAHNDADLTFVHGMIPHHEQAIGMADMVIARGESPEVKGLAERIKAAQTPEIELMRGWLEQWGEGEMPSGSDAEHGGTMMSDADIAELDTARGAALDKLFLEMMIRHHEGAISMAEEELDNGEFEAALELAQTISDTQQSEITEMKALLTETAGPAS